MKWLNFILIELNCRVGWSNTVINFRLSAIFEIISTKKRQYQKLVRAWKKAKNNTTKIQKQQTHKAKEFSHVVVSRWVLCTLSANNKNIAHT